MLVHIPRERVLIRSGCITSKGEHLLPPLAFANHTLNTIHRTVGTGYLAVGRDVVTLHHVAAHLPRAAGSAGLGGPPLDGLGIAIGIDGSSNTRALLGRWRRRGGGLRVVEAITAVVVGGGSFVRHEGRGECYTCKGGRGAATRRAQDPDCQTEGVNE
jgi:hypothetical protein